MTNETEIPAYVAPPNRIRVWLAAARPKTLSAAGAPIVIAAAMAAEAGALHWPSVLAALIGALLIQIGTNFANDYFDFVKGADTADRIGPTRATAAGMIRPEVMRRAMVITFALVFVPGAYILYRGGMPFLVIGLVSIACGVLYTAGPMPLAYIGLGDLFVLIFFGPVAVAGTYYLQALELPLEVIIAGFGPGLMSTAILTANNIRDIEQDRAANKRTLAARFGRKFAQAEYLTCLFGAMIVVPTILIFMTGQKLGLLLCVFTITPAIPAIRAVLYARGPALNPALGATAHALWAYAIFFAIGWYWT